MRTHLLFAALLLTALASAAQSAKSDSLYNAARALYERGQYRQAIPLFEQAWEMDKAEAPDDPDLAGNTGMWLASCHYRLGDKTKAETIEPMFYELPPTDRALTAKARSYAKLAANATSIDNAIYWMERCAEAEKEAFGDDCADVYGTYCNIAFFAMQNGNEQQCRDYIARAKAVEKHVPVSTTAWRGMAWGQEAALEMALGNTDEAKAAADVAWGYLKGYMHLYGTRYYDALNVILSVNANGNNIEEANAAAEQALEEYKKLADKMAMELYPIIFIIARYYSETQQPKKILSQMGNAIERAQDDSEAKAELLFMRGRLYISENNIPYAIKDFNKAMDIYGNISQHELLGDVYVALGDSYRIIKDFGKSRNSYNKALSFFKKRKYIGDYVNVLSKLSMLANDMDFYKESLSYIDKCVDLMKHHKIGVMADFSFIYNEQGKVLLNAHLENDAAEAFRKGIRICDLYKMYDNTYFELIVNLYSLLVENVNSKEAEELLVVAEDKLSDNFGLKLRLLDYKTNWQIYREDLLGAISTIEQSLELWRKVPHAIIEQYESTKQLQSTEFRLKNLIGISDLVLYDDYVEEIKIRFGADSRQYLECLLKKCELAFKVWEGVALSESNSIGNSIIALANKHYKNNSSKLRYALCLGARMKSYTHPIEARGILVDMLNGKDVHDRKILVLIYSTLADIENKVGDYVKSIGYCTECLRLVKSEEQRKEYARVFITYGKSLLGLGRLGDAEDVFKEAIRHSDTFGISTTASIGLSEVYKRMGCYVLAEKYDANINDFVNSHIGSNSLLAEGRIQSIWQKYNKGQKDECYKEIEEIEGLYRQMGDSEVDMSTVYRLYSLFWMYEQDVELADVYIKAALAIQRNYENLQVASQIAFNMADYYLSAAYAREMLQIAQDNLGKDAFETIAAHKLLGDATLQIGSVDEATKNYRKAFDNGSRYIYGNLLSLTSEQRADFWASNYDFFRTYLPRLCYGYDAGESMSGLLYDAALFSNGLLLNVDKSVARAVQAAPQDVRDLYTEWSSKKEYLGRMAVQNPEADASALQADVSALEKQLISRLREGGGSDDGTWSAATWQQVRKALPKGAAAVEFMDFSVDSLTNAGMALVLTRDMKYPRVCKLYKRMADDDLQWEGLYADTIIGNLIWGNLADAVAGCTDIYFTPQGPLCSIALESLPTSRLAAGVGMHRLSSTRELVRPRRKRRQQGGGATLYGGLNYDTSIAEMQADAERYPALRKRGFVADNLLFKRDLRDGDRYIPYLKGSRMEVDSITSLMSRVAGFSPVCKRWNDGTETSFKALSGAYGRVLHVSTHGFFVDPNDSVASALTVEDRALQQSGLLMSGAANKLNAVAEIPDDLDDGILTAAEIASLDLSDVDIAVLSACETALGRVTGEGVFGLQRGFKKAGARSLLMSLWKVDDDATCALVTEFYRRWLGDPGAGIAPQSKQAALEAAKACVRSNPDWDDPEYWAAFVLLDALD